MTELEIQFSANDCDFFPILIGASVIWCLARHIGALISWELNHSNSQILQSSKEVTKPIELSSFLTSLWWEWWHPSWGSSWMWWLLRDQIEGIGKRPKVQWKNGLLYFYSPEALLSLQNYKKVIRFSRHLVFFRNFLSWVLQTIQTVALLSH